MAKLNSGTRIYGNLTIDTWANITGTTTSTSTTTGALVVAGGAGIAGNLNVGGPSTISISSANDALRITQTGSGNVLVVEDSVNPDATSFVITANGQVGVGNVSPQATLHVKGNSGVGGLHTDFIVEAEGSGNARFFLKTATNNRNWEFFAAGSDGGFGVYDGVGVARRFTILPSGNVGINSSTPVSNLSIGTTTATSTATPITMDLGGTFSSSAGSNGKLKVWYDASSYMGLGVSSNQLDYIVSSSSYSHVWYQGGAEKMRLAATSGNVAISTTTASTNTTTGALVVAGGAGIAGRVTAGNIMTTSGVYWANGAAYSSGGGSGGITYTASATAPGSPSSGNFWYDTAADVKYQYINDGTSSYWVDQSYPTSFGNLTVANTLTVSGSIVGTTTNANYASAANVSLYESVAATTTNATFYPMLSGTATGNTASFTSSSLVYNPSTGNLVVASTTASTSTTTGALVVRGGAGIAGNIVTAGTANKFTGCVAIGSSNPTHKLQISLDGYNTRISDSTNGYGYNIGRSTTDGLLYFYGDQTVYTGYVFSGVDGERVKISSTGNLVINATTSSSTTTSGALVVKGGAGIAGTMTVGGLITGKPGTGGVAAVSNDTGSISIRGDATNAAVISFHRPSVYAINMGLDTDNVFKIGGWSATANCFQLTGAGALTLTGGITTTGNIVPSANLTYNLGSTTAWWNNVYGVSVQAKYADLAEHYTADDLYGPGTVVVFGGTKEITVSNISHDPRVAGVISTNPAYLMNAANAGLPVALTGRVPCQVQGPVAKGDRLVNVDTGIAGRLDPALHEYGCIVGKSLGEIADDSIQTIEIVVGRF